MLAPGQGAKAGLTFLHESPGDRPWPLEPEPHVRGQRELQVSPVGPRHPLVGVPVVLTKDPTDMHLSCGDVGAAVG